MKFISPSVTVSPTDRTKSSIPKAKSSNSTMTILLNTNPPHHLVDWIPARPADASRPRNVLLSGPAIEVRAANYVHLVRGPVQRVLDLGNFVDDHVLQLP